MRPLFPVMAMVALFFLTIGMALPVLPLQVHDTLHFDAFVVGLVAGAQFVASLVTRLWAGRLADTRGPRFSVFLGLASALVGGGLYLLSSAWVSHPLFAVSALLVGRTLIGGAESLIITSSILWGLGLMPPTQAGKVISWVGMAMFAAMAVGSPVGSGIYAAWGFLGIGLTAVVLPAVALALVPLLRQTRVVQGERPSPLRVASAVLWPGIGFALSGITFGAVTSFLTLYFAVRGWPLGAAAFSVFTISLIVARVVCGHLPDRYGGARVAMYSLLVQIAGLILVGVADTEYVAMLGAGLAGAGFSLVFPSLGLEAVARVPVQSRGSAMGTYNAFLDATLGFGGPLLGLLASMHGFTSVFLASAAAAALGIPVAWRLQRMHRLVAL